MKSSLRSLTVERMLSKTEVDAELVQDELTKEHKLWYISDP